MATTALEEEEQPQGEEDPPAQKLLSSFLGLSFCVFLASAPKNSLSLVPSLHAQIQALRARLLTAEEQLRQMKSRRKEDSKANARVVEIFASHRNAWQEEEKQLLQQIENQRAKIEEMERERQESKQRNEELEEMIGFMSRRDGGGQLEEESEELGVAETRECYGVEEEVNVNGAAGGGGYGQYGNFGFPPDFLASASKFWGERANPWQDVQYESLDSTYNTKHFVARRESPWKVDGESTGVSSKLKLLEQELLNLEKIGNSDLSKVPSLLRKQAKRYQALTGKIDDLCRRMQASDPSEPTLSPEFRTQRQTEFLLEAFRLQQRASETGQKLMALQTEIGKSYHADELGNPEKLTTRRSFDSIRNNLKEIQRNLEIWLARIIGDLEGILARDGSSRVREYCSISRYPFVQ
ncbi:hypothetical protein SLE2022_223910 [Rubroshorea leprosula]